MIWLSFYEIVAPNSMTLAYKANRAQGWLDGNWFTSAGILSS
jgi:hypothetical protein